MQTQRVFNRIEKIYLQNLTKKYNEHYAVQNLTLQIEGGELLILIGGSGSGKTTTLKMINRLVEPDEGIITINGMDIRQINPVVLRRNIGYVIQQIGLFPHLTIQDNIGLIPHLEKWEPKRIEEKVIELLRLVDLNPETFMHRYPKELSGGQQQRIGLARALVTDPPLLLMDEPFGALDPILRKQLQKEFLKIKEDIGRTIVFVTHDIEEAFRLGDRIAIMHEGKLIQVGTPDELILHPQNRLVADLVNADEKYKHLNDLLIQELMIPLTKNHVIRPHISVQKIRSDMMKQGIEMGIVADQQTIFGLIKLHDLYNAPEELTVEQLCTQIPSYQYNTKTATLLHDLKSHHQPIALILDNNRPIGLFIGNEQLMKIL